MGKNFPKANRAPKLEAGDVYVEFNAPSAAVGTFARLQTKKGHELRHFHEYRSLYSKQALPRNMDNSLMLQAVADTDEMLEMRGGGGGGGGGDDDGGGGGGGVGNSHLGAAVRRRGARRDPADRGRRGGVPDLWL